MERKCRCKTSKEKESPKIKNVLRGVERVYWIFMGFFCPTPESPHWSRKKLHYFGYYDLFFGEIYLSICITFMVMTCAWLRIETSPRSNNWEFLKLFKNSDRGTAQNFPMENSFRKQKIFHKICCGKFIKLQWFISQPEVLGKFCKLLPQLVRGRETLNWKFFEETERNARFWLPVFGLRCKTNPKKTF